MLAYYYLSTHTLRVVGTEENGDPLTGATVTADLAFLSGAPMTAGTIEVGTLSLSETATLGTYEDLVVHNLDVQPAQRFVAKVKAVKGGVQRYAELLVEVTVDRT